MLLKVELRVPDQQPATQVETQAQAPVDIARLPAPDLASHPELTGRVAMGGVVEALGTTRQDPAVMTVVTDVTGQDLPAMTVVTDGIGLEKEAREVQGLEHVEVVIEGLMMQNMRVKADPGIIKPNRGVSTVVVMGPVKSVPVRDTHLRTVPVIRSFTSKNAQNVQLMGESFTTPLTYVASFPPLGILPQNQPNLQFLIKEMKMYHQSFKKTSVASFH